MEYRTLNDLRELFLSFFESKGHLRRESAPLIPDGDDSLLLINSGMAPLKRFFSGEVPPPAPRLTTCQKCIRTPDIERVGKTSRHGTFFEMLGNFSFGDYFKREAIAFAYEFVIDVLKIPMDRLYFSVYLEDDEAAELWEREMGVPKERIVRLGKEDNFWEIGSGPCGPCSEIYYDRGPEFGCGRDDCAPGCDCDRFVEFWNLVFTQFHNDGNGNYTPLEKKNIDTGLGLERLACIMQGVDNLFEVDTIRALIDQVAGIAGKTYKADPATDVSLRVVTDHIRSTVMLISDGVQPSNEGQGYVLRRLLRRAARHGRLLGIERPFLKELSDTVIATSGGAYPTLVAKRAYIQSVVEMEEERFHQTIDQGMRLLSETIERMKKKTIDTLSGEEAFKLYDTYGFPVDLTLEILGENRLFLDRSGFDRLMQEQRDRARDARKSAGDLGWATTALELDGADSTEFIGYDSFVGTAKILAILRDGTRVEEAESGKDAAILLDRTPFYAESGGQVDDTGVLTSDAGTFQVKSVKKMADGKILHVGIMKEGALTAGQAVSAEIDAGRRRAIMRAHSATHVLHKALRSVLGPHAEQTGSLVEPDRLRFDFSHPKALTPAELAEIDRMANDAIYAGLPVDAREMPLAEARSLGATALFGEKYGDIVRLVKMGNYSLELCGGTHVDNTSKIGAIKITSEASSAAGVRRIEAKTGRAVLSDYDTMKLALQTAAGLFHAQPAELVARATQALEELRQMRKQFNDMRSKDVLGGAEQILQNASDIEGLKVATAVLDGVDAAALRKVGDWLRDKEPSVVAVLAIREGEKATFFAVSGKEAVRRGILAGDLVREVCRITGGKGGGKAESAMGGGKDPAKVEEALRAVESYVREHIK